MNILLLGASGFIGSEIARRLLANGHSVTGLARDIARARRLIPSINWLQADLSQLGQPLDWIPLLTGQDMVINAAGALQDGPRDNVAASQEHAMFALYAAAKDMKIHRIVQISAHMAGSAAGTPFLATKRAADRQLQLSGVDYVILRPALVIGRNAYGGTALLRALASMPFATILTHADRPIATVALCDVVEAVSRSVDGRIAAGSDLELFAGPPMALAALVGAHRQWLGLPTSPVIALPDFCARPVALLADLAGRLGWRSPLRSTAMAVMADGVGAGQDRPDMTFLNAEATLASFAAGVQDLWFARLYLAKPLILGILALFWTLSGVIALCAITPASAHFLPLMPAEAAVALAVVTALADIALGVMVLFRNKTRLALVLQMLLASSYLAGGTIVEPALWLDPLGPYVKVLPALVLSLVALAIFEDR